MKILKVKSKSEIGIPMVGTKAVKGYKLVLFAGAVKVEIDEDGKDITEYHKVIAEENSKVDQSVLLPYFLPVPKLSKSGKVTGEKPLTNLDGKLQCLAGKTWMFK